MIAGSNYIRSLITAALIASFWLTPIAASGQDLVTVSSITGNSSVFVFRSASRPKRFIAAARPTRTKVQQLASVNRIRKQYETIARVTPRVDRAKVVDPAKQVKTIGPIEGSKQLAGIGEYFLQQGDVDQAIERFREAITLDGNNVNAKNGLSEGLALKGSDLLLKDQATTAKGVFSEALRYNPNNAAAHFGLGEVYAQLNQLPEAIASYERSLANDKNLTEIYVPLGILYYQSGEIAKADENLTKALEKSADSAETQFFLGLVRAAQGRNEEALAAFQKAQTIDPTYAEAFYNSGETLVKLKRPAEAITDYQRAMSLKSGYFDAMLGLGDAYLDLKKYPEALAAYKSAAALKNDNWEVYAGLGEAYRWTEDYNNAEANFNLAALFYTRTKDFNKDTAADLYSKAAYVIGRQCPVNMEKFVPCKWNTAVKDLEKAVELGQNPLDFGNLGWAYYNSARMDLDARMPDEAKAKLELARTNLQKALVNPAIAEGVLQNLGAVQIDLGDYKGAIESLKPVVAKRPDWVFSTYALGTAYFKDNNFDEAAKAFQLAVDKDPDNISYLMSLGVAHVRRKNEKDVRAIIERLKKLNGPAALKIENEGRAAKVITGK